MLGEDHPVTMIWTQREDLLLQVANEALHLSHVVLRSCEEDRNSEGTTEAEAASIDTVQPAVVKVKVCPVKVNDAASNLPVGDVASESITVDADIASRPQDAPAESGQHHDKAQSAAGLQTADTMQPAKDQVQVFRSIKVNNAPNNLPAGDVASGGITVNVDTASRPKDAPADGGQQHDDAKPAAGLQYTVTRQPAKDQVQVCRSVKINAAAHNLPVGDVASGGITVDADTASRSQDAPAEGGQQHEDAQSGAGLQAADTMKPATVQVQVCSLKVNDAAANLPVGDVASGGITGDADTASRPRDARAEGGQQSEDAQAAAGLRVAGTTQPAVLKVRISTSEANDAAHNLPPGRPH